MLKLVTISDIPNTQLTLYLLTARAVNKINLSIFCREKIDLNPDLDPQII